MNHSFLIPDAYNRRETQGILPQVRLVVRWLSVRGHAVLVCNQPLRPTQPPCFKTFSRFIKLFGF